VLFDHAVKGHRDPGRLAHVIVRHGFVHVVHGAELEEHLPFLRGRHAAVGFLHLLHLRAHQQAPRGGQQPVLVGGHVGHERIGIADHAEAQPGKRGRRRRAQGAPPDLPPHRLVAEVPADDLEAHVHRRQRDRVLRDAARPFVVQVDRRVRAGVIVAGVLVGVEQQDGDLRVPDHRRDHHARGIAQRKDHK